MPSAIVLAATGFEPIELTTTVDFLRRAGVDVKIAAVGTAKLEVEAAHGMTLKADVMFKDVAAKTFDAVICPGGMPGTKNLAKDKMVVDFVKKHFEAGKICGAICAAPGFVFADACGILKGKKACGYPGCDKAIQTEGGILVEDYVTRDGNVITSRGPGTTPLFALELIKALCGEAKAEDVKKGAICPF